MKADARSIALEVLRRVLKDHAFASSTLRAAFGANPQLCHQDRGLTTELVYGVLRRRGMLDLALRKASGRRIKDIDPRLLGVLRIAAYQLIYLDRVPDHAAVNCAVDTAKRLRGPRGGAFTNAVLRKLTGIAPEERVPTPPCIDDDPAAHVSQAGSLPMALAQRLVEDLGAQDAAAFAIASLDAAPLSLRTNLLRGDRQSLLQELEAEPGALPYSVRLPPAGGRLPGELEAVKQGRATPQDEASMRVVELLDPRPGETILDLCAAPGGKTTHTAERMNNEGRVVAHDRLPARLARVLQSAERLGLSIIELSEPLPEDKPTFDRVLVDAPCSGLGTLRRHPEIRWRLTDRDITELTRTQAEVLAQGAARVRPGGTLVYSVCTVTRAEGEAQVEQLGEQFKLDKMIRTSPHHDGAPDGFFAARLVKQV